MEDIILCQYGCGQEAKFVNKSGKYTCSKYCTQCPVNRKKNSCGGKIAHAKNPEKYFNRKLGGPASKQWRQKNPQKYLQSLKKQGNTYSQNQKSGKFSNPFFGKKHTKASKEKISNGTLKWKTHSGLHSKYYPVYCPYMRQTVKVQGTWQLKYAEYLNQNKINWIRSRNINLKYRLHQDDYLHTYYPDFYLPDMDKYIQIKGWYSEQCQIKMKKVFDYNPNKQIDILLKDQLKNIIDI